MRKLARQLFLGIEKQGAPAAGVQKPLSGIPAWRRQVQAEGKPQEAEAKRSAAPASAASSPAAQGAKAAPAAKKKEVPPVGLQENFAMAAKKRLEDAKLKLAPLKDLKAEKSKTQDKAATPAREVPDPPKINGKLASKPSPDRAKLLQEARQRDAAKTSIAKEDASSSKQAASTMSIDRSRSLQDAVARDRTKSVSQSAAPAAAPAAAPVFAPAAKAPVKDEAPPTAALDGLLEGYGNHVFKGAVADSYLKGEGLPAGTIEAGQWHKDKAIADKVAAAIMKWATDNGASVLCHWFQPLGSSGVRHGQSGQVQNAFFNFDKAGIPVWDLKGKDLIQGETDGSSYPTGGLRDTHTAGGYLTVDPTSPMWLRGDTVFIPAALVSYHGHAIDEKTPLLRSVEALSREGTRLLKLLGYEVSGLQSNIGLEQEFFLVPREAYKTRLDLQMAGRTIMGMDAPRGQEMCDHYMGPPSLGSNAALACMQEVQDQCYKLGIPLRTRHREVAPNQYEFAPFFGTVTTQIDQNLIVMQILEEVASNHGFACLVQEKPFNNINGSGKHNNWSIITDDGVNLFNMEQLAKATGNSEIFPVIMSCVIAAVDMHGDLMRMAIASPGNDFRLGACEAPPAIMSTYFGQDLTNYLKDYRDGKGFKKVLKSQKLDLGASCLKSLDVPTEDRNRTSPFPYGGHRFEFRSVGSSQNVSLVNTVLNTMCASMFKKFGDVLQGGNIRPHLVASNWLDKHWKVIFNGDNYAEHWQKMLTDNGVWRIDSGIDAICRFTDGKNTELFSRHGVLTPEECAARQTVMLEHYAGTVEIEAKCMVQMFNQHVIPAVKRAGVGPSVESLTQAVGTLEAAMKIIHEEEDLVRKANMARMLRLEDMVEIRELADAAEAVVPADLWTMATYKDLLFLDYTAQ
jgi:glutamine synthetase